jgi:tetratricopeptide (TPR) repeat protein
MKKKIHFLLICFFLLCPLLLPPVVSCQEAAPSADAIVKLLDLKSALTKIDQVARSINPNQVPPSVILQSVLQGTDWIDTGRPLALAVFLKPDISQIPDLAAIVPFRNPNPQFQSSYNAVLGEDYYIVPLPPGSANAVSDRMEQALVSALQKPPESTVSVEVAASQLIEKARPEIEKKLSELEAGFSAEAEKEISPEQVREMLEGFLDTGEQVETFFMGFDLNDQEISFLSRIVALAGSELAESLRAGPEKEEILLADYQPDHPIRFKSRPYDMAGLLDFLDEKFGAFYREIGIDFTKLADAAARFSGEMAGGLSLTEEGFALEIISLLKPDKDRPKNYLEQEYIPWIMDYAKSFTEFFNAQASGFAIEESIVEKMPESTIDGNTVYGLKFTLPASIGESAGDLEIPVRMTLFENMLLTATDDKQIKALLQKAKDLEKKAYAGPLMQMEMDLDAYLKTIARFAPDDALQDAGPVPSLGALTYTMDISERALETRYSLQVEDIRKMASYFKTMAGEKPGSAQQKGQAPPDKRGQEAPPAAPSKENPDGRDPEKTPRSAAKEADEPDKDSPQYWMNKGQLYATYGNANEAIKHFQKAAELDPQNSKAYFHLGVSYGDKGEFQKGIEALDKAIRLRPEDGDYYYARGWVYSLAGKRGLAEADMERAAELGNADAIAYIEKIQNR